MFGIFHDDDEDADNNNDKFETLEQWRIERARLVCYVKGQGSLPSHVTRVWTLPPKRRLSISSPMFVVTGLGNVRAGRDEYNAPLHLGAPPVLHAQNVKLQHGDFIQRVLDP
uniref:Uncharacterized protein n=1 Tax=Peronospora matthiolae TaxID=2874970 RepID=A0AAV1TK98_9STRA